MPESKPRKSIDPDRYSSKWKVRKEQSHDLDCDTLYENLQFATQVESDDFDNFVHERFYGHSGKNLKNSTYSYSRNDRTDSKISNFNNENADVNEYNQMHFEKDLNHLLKSMLDFWTLSWAKADEFMPDMKFDLSELSKQNGLDFCLTDFDENRLKSLNSNSKIFNINKIKELEARSNEINSQYKMITSHLEAKKDLPMNVRDCMNFIGNSIKQLTALGFHLKKILLNSENLDSLRTEKKSEEIDETLGTHLSKKAPNLFKKTVALSLH